MNRPGLNQFESFLHSFREHAATFVARLLGYEAQRNEWNYWREKHLRINDMVRHDPLYEMLVIAKHDATKQQLLDGGLEDATAELVAREHDQLEQLALVGGLPHDGLGDDELGILGFRVEPAAMQGPDYRLTELPEGWRMDVPPIDPADIRNIGYVVNDAEQRVLEFDFFVTTPGSARGSVRLYQEEASEQGQE